MIKFDDDICLRVKDIYHAQYNNPVANIDLLLELSSYFSTYEVVVPVLSNYPAYWHFLHTCLDNLDTGFWSTLPITQITVMCNPLFRILTEKQVNEEFKAYLKHREKVLKKKGLPTLRDDDRKVLYHWISSESTNNSVRTKSGYDSLINISHTLLRVFLYFTQSHIPGIINSAALIKPEDQTKFPAFDNANTKIPPLIGRTKMEIVRNNYENSNTSDD